MAGTGKTLSAGVMIAALGFATTPAAAMDGWALEAGSGDSTDMARIAVQRDWNRRWFEGAEWHVGGYWDLSLSQWRSSALPGQNRHITEVGLTPVFRLQRNGLAGAYLEAAVGFHLLSKTTISDKRLSTRFQFGDHVGLGYRFGARGAWDLGYRFQHLSNGGIKKPNNGINFHQVRLQYHF